MDGFGERVIKLLEEVGYTQREFAGMVGISEGALCRYLKDLREPKMEVIANMATALNTITDFLLTGKNDTKTLQDHFNRHGAQVGTPTKESYAAHAVKFANTVNRQDCVSFVDAKGSTYKYNKKTNEFAVITKKGIVVTYFKPTDGYSYYLNEKKGKANHGRRK